MSQEDFKRKLTAILSADVVGYSRLMGDDEAATVKTLETYKGVMFSLIKQHRGRVIDSPGDNLLAEFGSVVDAVQCAVSIQKELQARNADLPETRRMEFRIGINLGDVIEEQDRIYGDGVNIAARIESLADPGGICISGTAYDQVKTKLDYGYEYLGEHSVKNISEPLRVYRVLMDSKFAGKIIGEKKETGRLSRLIVSSAIIVIIIAAGLTGWMIYSHHYQTKEMPKTIAVLPFANLSPESDQEYFADGIAEELLNHLSRIAELEVRGRTSSFFFKNKSENLDTISKMLNVRYILEGSVRKAGNQVRIAVQLINTRKDTPIWSETYDRTMDDIFAIQDDIARSVVDALQITLGVGEFGRVPGMTRNVAAYDAYLAGHSLKLQIGRENISQAIKQLEKAVAIDPAFAICWSELAILYNEAAESWFPERSNELLIKSRDAVSRVIEIAPESDLALFFVALGNGDRIKLEQYYKKGIALNPTSYDMNYQYGWFLNTVGRSREAIDYFKRLVRLEPLASMAHINLGLAFGLSGNLDAAIVSMEKARDLTNEPPPSNAGLLLLSLGINDRVLLDKYLDQDDMKTLLDKPEKALPELRRRLADLRTKDFDRDEISIWASYFGDHELALQVHKKLMRSDPVTYWQIWRPIHKKMRQLPGFKDLVREYGLVDYWQKSGEWGDFCHSVGEDDFVCE